MKRKPDNIDKLVDDVFGKYCRRKGDKPNEPDIALRKDNAPTFIVKKSRIGVVLKRDNSLALLYQNKKRNHKGKVLYPVEIRNIGRGLSGATVTWMEKGEFALL